MPIVADGAVRVGADLAPFNKELNRGLGQAEQRAQTFGQKINSALSPKNLAAGLGIAFGASQVVSFFGDAIQSAGEFQDTVSATGIIFGEEAIPVLQEWADEAHSAFGASKQDALAAANQFASMGQMAGVMGEELVGFSTELVQLAGDLASMYGGRTEDAIAAVGSALRGEFEPIRAYNVLLDDATLRQQAFEMGLISTTQNALTPQQKVLAAQAAIFAQTTNAQGNFALTSGDLMNVQRDLVGELENVSIEVGQEMLPIMLSLVTFLKDEGIPIMREFIGLLDFGDANSAEGIPILGEIEDALNTAIDSSFVFRDMLLGQENAVGQAAEAMSTDYMTMHRRIKTVMDEMGVDHQTAIDTILSGLMSVSEAAAWHDLEERQGGAAAGWNNLGQVAGDVAGAMPGDFQEASDEAVEIARKLPGALADVLMADIGDYQIALDELAEVAVNSVSDMTERQAIEGVLGSQALTDALNSDSTRTQLLAQQFVADRIEEYELLAPGALGAGELVVPSLNAGIMTNIQLAQDGSQAIVNAAGQPLVDLDFSAGGASLIESWIRGMEGRWSTGIWRVWGIGDAVRRALGGSLPTEGPLAGGIASGGRSVIESWFSDMERVARGEMGTVVGIAAAAGAALNPATAGYLPLNSLADSGPGSAAGAGMTININAPTTPMTPRDIGRELRRTGAFGVNT